jgi:CheY-like chemotaxis protein
MPPLTSPPPTILIVEDEPSIACALTRLLTRDGYQAEVARNGQEALTACQRQAYTQILCDLWMPVLDGQGFYEALHRCQPQLCPRGKADRGVVCLAVARWCPSVGRDAVSRGSEGPVCG